MGSLAMTRKNLISLVSVTFVSMLMTFSTGAYAQAPSCECGEGYTWAQLSPSSSNFFSFTEDGQFVYATGADITTPITISEKKYIKVKHYDLDTDANPEHKMQMTYNGEGQFVLWICLEEGINIADGHCEYVQHIQGLGEETSSEKELVGCEKNNNEATYSIENQGGSFDTHINSVISVEEDEEGNAILGVIDWQDINL